MERARTLDKSLARIATRTLRRIIDGKFEARTGAIHDGGSLYLRLRPGGGSWCFRYERDGRQIWMGLGSVAHVPAAEAREMARQFRTSLALGDHPLHQRTAERRERRAEARAGYTTFREVAERMLATYDQTERHQKTRDGWRRVLTQHCYPVLGPKLIDDVTTADILDVLRPIWGSRPDAAQRTRIQIERVFEEARVSGLTTRPNPARLADLRSGLAPFNIARPANHHAAMPWREVPALMKRLAGSQSLAAKALRLTILSACRTREALGAGFVEFQHGAWTVPAERVKPQGNQRRDHRVPISTGIAALLDELEAGRVNSALLFASRSAVTSLSSMSMSMHLKRVLGIYDATVHGFRSSFRDWCADNGVSREVAEACLAHVVGGTEGAYRRSDLFEQRRAVMQQWSDFCLGAAGATSSGEAAKRVVAKKK